MTELKHDAQQGGAVAGRTRKDIEKQIGKKVISSNNFLPGEQLPCASYLCRLQARKMLYPMRSN
jgi:hypothetical protein